MSLKATHFLAVVCVALFATASGAAEPNETLLFDPLTESYSPGWHLNHGTWKIVDGGFRGVEDPAENHGAAVRYRVGKPFTDCTFEWEFRCDGARMVTLSINDESRHLCRVRIRERDVQVFKDDTDGGGPDESKLIATTKMKIAPGVWHQAKVTIVGDALTAEIDGAAVVGKHAQFALPKENFAIVIAGDSASFRNFRATAP